MYHLIPNKYPITLTNLFHLCTIDCLLGLCYLYGERRPIPLPLAAIWRYDIYIGRDAHSCTIACPLAECYLYGEWCPILVPLTVRRQYVTCTGRGAPSLYHYLSSDGMLPEQGVVPHLCTTGCPLVVCYLYGEWCPMFVPLAVLWWYVTCTGSGAPSLYQWLSASSMLPVRGAVPHLCTTGCPLAAWRPPGRPAPGSPRHSGFW